MNTIYILIGNIGSGKSTWAKKWAQDYKNVIIINRDYLREMIKYKYTFDNNFEPLISECRELIFESTFLHGFDVILDETNLTKEHRKKLLDIPLTWSLREEFKVVYVYFPENKRNVEFKMNSNGRSYSKEYWQEVYNNMANILEVPEKEEGYDELITVEIP